LPHLAEALVDGGPRFVEFLEKNTEIRLRLVHGYPDYHPEHPGGLPRGGRSIEPELLSLPGLAPWGDRIAGDVRRMLIAETPLGGGTGVVEPDVLAEREAAQLEGLGRALVGGLLRACLERSVEIATGTRGIRLLTEDGAVTGVELET